MYGNYYVLIYELAYENGSKEAPVKLYEFYKNDGRPIRAMEWLKIVADAGDKDYQFEYAKVLLEEGKESEAKHSKIKEMHHSTTTPCLIVGGMAVRM